MLPPSSPMPMLSSVSVAVSGVTGYIGAQIAHDLLQRGYTVHGTCRTNTPAKLAHLTSIAKPGRLRIFEADLLRPGSFDAAVAGCTYAIHVASPYKMDAADPQKELVDPAVQGTQSFLASCRKAGVRRVVVTSSLAAVADGGAGGRVVTEKDWNTRSSLTALPYYFSKVQAERAAWAFAKAEKGVQVVTVNPTMVLGPSLVPGMNESMGVLRTVVKGEFFGIVDLEFPVVDVRDVSEAHIRAMESEGAAGRYLCFGGGVMMKEVAQVAQEQGFKPPMTNLRGGIVTKIIKTTSRVSPGGQVGVYTRRHLGNPIVPSTKKIKEELGMSFRDPRETVREAYEDMVKRGHLQKPGAE